ncbi:MAG: DegV family protein [Chloroflexi bacterium]|nr:DegV family protein [Chloroflexota bacterium]
MGKIVVLTDSCAALPSEFVERHNVRVIPLYLMVDGKTYRDGVDMTPEAFYEMLPKTTALPTTSQPSVGDFVTAYRELVAAGATDIVSIQMAGGISGTVNSARTAAQEVTGARIEIVDTQCAVAIEYVVIEAVVRAIENGADMDTVLAICNRVLEQQRTVFLVDTLEYLYKGGRIGGATALVGSLLQFKPILHFVDGKITALERQRTTVRALHRLAELQVERFGKAEPLRAVLMQAACPERAQELDALLKQELNVAESTTVVLSPVIGAHAGPGTLGLCCCPIAAF